MATENHDMKSTGLVPTRENGNLMVDSLYHHQYISSLEAGMDGSIAERDVLGRVDEKRVGF